MSLLPALRRQTFESPCTVEIERSAETLEAHVVIDGDYDLRPGDEVLVRDPPTDSPFGERIVVRRMATITQSGASGADLDSPCWQFRARRTL